MRRLLVAALVTVTQLPTALADDNKSPPSDTSECKRTGKNDKNKCFSMEPIAVDGKGVKYDMPSVVVLDWGKAGSLIRIRRDFIAEIVKTAEDL